MDKDALIERLDKLMTELTEKEKGLNILIWSLPNTSRKIDELISNSIDLQNQILQFDGDIYEFNNLRKRVIEHERLSYKLITRLGFLPKVLLTYVGFLVIVYIALKVNIASFIVQNLGVKAPEKLISLGIAGACLYLATEFLSYQEKLLDQKIKIATFLVRLSLAIVVPIVLVILFFNESGEIKKLSLSPEILSFSCGYSAKLVIGIFNKIVEKGTKMIEAI